MGILGDHFSKESESCLDYDSVVKGFVTIENVALVNDEGIGMDGVSSTTNEIFGPVKYVGANVIMII